MEDNGDNSRSANDGGQIVKTVPVVRDLSLNPSCDHGPTILFERDNCRFFSCSAYRCRKLCGFYMPEEKWKSRSLKSVSRCETGGEGGTAEIKKRKLVESFEVDKIPNKAAKLAIMKNNPFAIPNQRNKGEAQYHFNEKTVTFFLRHFKELKIDSVLCIGTPSLHERISNNDKSGEVSGLKSFLLDIDQRFANIYKNGSAMYNMCNHHFFQDSSNYTDFLSGATKLAIVVDPPFGVKVELIWHGCLSGVKKDMSHVKGPSFADIYIEILWIFPYFMEGHILSRCPDSKLQMSDFHIEYKNHPKYSGGSKSKSSPIRLFTTIPLPSLSLPEEDYRYCDTCKKWVDKQNLHCELCGACTTKDGGRTYNHCHKCKKCVKPSWSHCSKCKACHLSNSSEKCSASARNYQNQELQLNFSKGSTESFKNSKFSKRINVTSKKSKASSNQGKSFNTKRTSLKQRKRNK